MAALVFADSKGGASPSHRWSQVWLWLDRLEAWQRRKASVQTVAGHSLLAGRLSATARVLDAGAHSGRFGSFLHKTYGCFVTFVEPMRELLELEAGPHIHVVNTALSARGGTRRLFISVNPEATSFDSIIAATYGIIGERDVECRTLDEILSDCCAGGAEVVKLDIEGEEAPILLTAPAAALGAVSQLTVEFHDFLGDRLRRVQVHKVLRRLRRLGFLVFVFSRGRGSHDDTLLVNKNLVRLSMSERAHLWLLTRVTLYIQHFARSLACRWRQLIRVGGA